MNYKDDDTTPAPILKKMGYDPETKRYYTLSYLAISKFEYYVYASCSDFDLRSFDMKDYALEFLDTDMNPIDFPYHKELFDKIEDTVSLSFLEMKEDEDVKVASS